MVGYRPQGNGCQAAARWRQTAPRATPPPPDPPQRRMACSAGGSVTAEASPPDQRLPGGSPVATNGIAGDPAAVHDLTDGQLSAPPASADGGARSAGGSPCRPMAREHSHCQLRTSPTPRRGFSPPHAASAAAQAWREPPSSQRPPQRGPSAAVPTHGAAMSSLAARDSRRTRGASSTPHADSSADASAPP
jgi:hypothetical protein